MPKWVKVLKSKKVQSGVEKKAEKVKEYWQGIAPVFGDRPPKRESPSHGQPGDYKASISIEDHPNGDVPGKRVKDTDFKAKWIEFGNKHMPEYAPRAKTRAKFR
jgi:hypothetical protein